MPVMRILPAAKIRSALSAKGKVFAFAGLIAVYIGPLACSRQPSAAAQHYKPSYTEKDVRHFVVPGIDINTVIKRFGPPFFEDKNPRLEGGSTSVDQIVFFHLPRPPQGVREDFAFAGFQVYLKSGKVVWLGSIHETDMH